MYRTPREFIDKLGGYREVAARVGVSDKTMHSHVTAHTLPPRWYMAFCVLVQEQGLAAPGMELFSFVDLPPPKVMDVSEKVHTYAAALGVKPSTVVQRAAKLGGAAWAKWEAGDGSPTLRTADMILKYMEENPAPVLPTATVADGDPMARAG